MTDKDKNSKQLASEALPPVKLPEIPQADIEAAQKLLAQAAELEKLKDEQDPEGWGPGKPGKKWCNLPELPAQFGDLTINTTKEITDREGKKFHAVHLIRLKGKVQLTHDEYHEALHRIDRIIRQELEGRYGENRAKSIAAIYDVGLGAWVKTVADGRSAKNTNQGIF